MRKRYVVSLLVGAVALGACGAEGGSGAMADEKALSFSATLDSPADEPSDIYAMWQVSSGSPDYVYVWGRAQVRGERFSLSLATRPPEEAMNDYGLGVAALVVAPASAPLSDGVQISDSVFDGLAGVSARHAIIYVDHARYEKALEEAADRATAEELERARGHWLFDFPPGYGCGEGRDAEPGETFDSYVPVDCSEVQVHYGDLDEIDGVNWT